MRRPSSTLVRLALPAALLACRSTPVPEAEDLRAAALRPPTNPATAEPRTAELPDGKAQDPSAPLGGLDLVLLRIAAANPTLGQAQERLAAARAAVAEADATNWPELTLALGYVATDEPAQAFGLLMDQQDLTLGPAFDPTPGTTENWRKELRLDWALFAPGRAPLRHAARSGARAAELAALAIERRLLNAGVQAWLGLSAARALEGVARESIAVVERRLEQTRKRHAEGAALRADVLRLESRLAAARAEAARAALATRTARSGLNALMGEAPDAPLEGADEEPSIGSELDGLGLQALLERARTERMDLAAAAEGARAVGFQRAAAEDGRLPGVGLFAAYDIDGPDPALDRDLDSTTVGVGLRWTLSRRTGASIERASAAERAERHALAALATEVQREVHDAHAALEVAHQTLALAESGTAAAEEAYRIVARAQDAGGATVTDVLEAEDARRQARVAVVAARAGVSIARARLVGATGGVR